MMEYKGRSAINNTQIYVYLLCYICLRYIPQAHLLTWINFNPNMKK